MTRERSGRRINGAVVAVGLLFGLAYLLLGLSQGKPAVGFMLVVTMALVIGSRYSDTVALLGDDVHDERHVHIHQRAALYTINILGFVIVVGAIVDIARGGDGTPYIWLAGIGGLTYVGWLIVLSRRS
jgi:uncharacterized membrane protein